MFKEAMELVLAAEAAERYSLCLTGATADKNLFTSSQAPPASQILVYKVNKPFRQQNNTPKPGVGVPYHMGKLVATSGHTACPCKKCVPLL